MPAARCQEGLRWHHLHVQLLVGWLLIQVWPIVSKRLYFICLGGAGATPQPTPYFIVCVWVALLRVGLPAPTIHQTTKL